MPKLIGRFTSPLAVSPFKLAKTYDRQTGRGCCAYAGVCAACVKVQMSTGQKAYVYRTYPEHSGTDITVEAVGEPVRATAGGRAVTVVNDGGYHGGAGNHVEINHENGHASRYLHLMQAVVTHGQRVRRGQVIGYVGTTGNTSGPHLHFELYSDVPPEVENVFGYPGKVRLPEGDHMALIGTEWALGAGIVLGGLALAGAVGRALSRR